SNAPASRRHQLPQAVVSSAHQFPSVNAEGGNNPEYKSSEADEAFAVDSGSAAREEESDGKSATHNEEGDLLELGVRAGKADTASRNARQPERLLVQNDFNEGGISNDMDLLLHVEVCSLQGKLPVQLYSLDSAIPLSSSGLSLEYRSSP